MRGVHTWCHLSWHPWERWLLKACPACQNQLPWLHWSCLKASKTKDENIKNQLQTAITSSWEVSIKQTGILSGYMNYIIGVQLLSSGKNWAPWMWWSAVQWDLTRQQVMKYCLHNVHTWKSSSCSCEIGHPCSAAHNNDIGWLYPYLRGA